MKLRVVSVLFLLILAVVAGWSARSVVERLRSTESEADRAIRAAIFAQLLGPTACPPRVVEGRIAVGCEGIMLTDSTDIRGAVDIISSLSGRLTVSGWGADMGRSAPLKLVLVTVDGKVKFWTQPDTIRDDVAAALQVPALRLAGFSAAVAVPATFRHTDHAIRVFGVSESAKAAEFKTGP